MNLCIRDYGELFMIDLDQVAYMQSDDHYTHIYYVTDVHLMVPFGLVYIEKAIRDLGKAAQHLERVGRQHIVNLNRVFHVNVSKQELLLVGDRGKSFSLRISQTALTDLVEILSKNN